jgi:CxxC motif-containing protein (DUF1111 family)
MSSREYLDDLARRGIRPQFYDPDAEHYPLPTWPWKWAPAHMATRRQLRAQGLAPGGHDPVAQVVWRHHKQVRVAYLYDKALAVPKRQPTPAQLEAIGKALAARKTCPSCHVEQPYCLPRSLGECLDCAEGARRAQPEADREAA